VNSFLLHAAYFIFFFLSFSIATAPKLPKQQEDHRPKGNRRHGEEGRHIVQCRRQRQRPKSNRRRTEIFHRRGCRRRQSSPM
jgi:hypothetical protein